MIVTGVSDTVLPATTVKVPRVGVAVIVSVAATWAAAALLLVKATRAPPAGAAAFSVTVADTAEPEAIDGDDSVTALTAVAVGAGVVPEELPPVTVPPLVVVEVPLLVEPLLTVEPTPAGEAENELEGFAQPIEISSALAINAVASE